MGTTRTAKTRKRVRNLASKKLTPKETNHVKGGYIGETEKNRSASPGAGVIQKSSD